VRDNHPSKILRLLSQLEQFIEFDLINIKLLNVLAVTDEIVAVLLQEYVVVSNACLPSHTGQHLQIAFVDVLSLS